MMTPREIHTTTHQAAQCDPPTAEGRALIAMRDLLSSFIDTTNTPEFMKALSIDQTRLLNQLCLAVGP